MAKIEHSDKSVFVVILAFFMDIFSFGLIIPVIPFIIDELNTAPYGGDGIVFAWIVSIYSLTQLLSSFVWGRLSDRVGRRPIILIGLIGSTLSYLLMLFFLTIPGIFIARSLQGIFTGATLPSVRAFIADISNEEERTQRYGMLGAAYGLGFALGPSVGGITTKIQITDLNYLVIPMVFAATLTFLNFLAALYLVPETLRKGNHVEKHSSLKDAEHEFLSVIKLPDILALFIVFISMNLVSSSFETLFPLTIITDFDYLTPLFIGVLFLVVGVFVALIQIVAVPFIGKLIGDERVLGIGFAIMAIGTFMLNYISSLTVIVIGALTIAVGMGMSFPTVLSTTTARLPEDKQGVGAGMNEGFGGLGRIFGPLAGGYLFAKVGTSNTFIINSIFILIVSIYIFLTIHPANTDNAEKITVDSSLL